MSDPFKPVDRDTPYLLPPSLQDWLPQEHLARFVVEIVDRLDLSELERAYGGRGKTPYHPAVMVALLFYGYATGVFSSRKLEQATYDSVAFRYITADTHPDHDTIAHFRKRFLEPLRGLFVQILVIAQAMGVLKIGTVSLDGTKVKANAPPAILLREGWRENGKVRKRTLANLSKWPKGKIDTLRRLLKDEPLVGRDDAFDIVRSLPHGHVAAVLGTLRTLRLDRLIDPAHSPQRERVLAMVAARILDPGSKLATARGLAEATARDSLAETLGLGALDEDDLYASMDWLLERQDRIERGLAKRHLGEGTLVHGKFVLIVGVESCASSTRRRAFIAALSHVRRRISP